MGRPDITVLIPVYNGARYVAEAIQSVLSQTWRDLQIVVSDDHSTDGTPEVVRAFLDDTRIRLIERAGNLGMAGNFNACLQLVDTKYYLMLFQDDYLLDRGALERARDALEQHAAAVSVYSDMVFVDSCGRRIARRRFGRAGLVDPRCIARQSIIATRNLFGIALLNRTSAIAGVEYDDSLPYVLDVDMAISVSRGAQVFHIPEPLIANRYHRHNTTFSVMGNVRREDLRMADKHGIRLSPWELFVQRLNSWVSISQKRIFYRFIRWSSNDAGRGR